MRFEEIVAQLYNWKVYVGTEDNPPKPIVSDTSPIPEHNPAPILRLPELARARRVYSLPQIFTEKEFHERIERLQSWITGTWNNENPRYQVQLKAADQEHTEYCLTPLGYEKYIMLDFTQQKAEPKYHLYIYIDRCKRYFNGADRFQRFFENIVDLLRPPSQLLSSNPELEGSELQSTKRRLSCP